jgi:hypothetical protein
MSARQLSRREILGLPPTMSLATLAMCMGKSEPTIRKAHRSGELAAAGIRANKIGSTYVVITASVWDCLGLSPGTSAEARTLRPDS